jgi:16S rRNA processing protein RimM
MMSGGLVIIGKIVRAHGLRGEVKVSPLTDNPERFETLQSAVIQRPDGVEVPVSVVNLRPIPGHFLVTFEGYRNLTEVAGLIGGWISVPETEVPDLPDGRYYHFQILGMSVYEEGDGAYIGEIVEVFSTGSNDVYVVRNGPKEHLIPAIRDVVQEIDVAARRMTIRCVEGLL